MFLFLESFCFLLNPLVTDKSVRRFARTSTVCALSIYQHRGNSCGMTGDNLTLIINFKKTTQPSLAGVGLGLSLTIGARLDREITKIEL